MSHARSVGLLATTVSLWLVIAIPPVRAQGFFQSLFGNPTAAPRPMQRQLALPLPYRQSILPPPPESRAKSHESPDQGESSSGSYRTMCVRMCDGYYWPINQSSSRVNFYREAKLCQASCGSEARLFYHPNSSPDVNGMVDLTGRAYARLPNAFRYRKTLVAGCQCKPAPWTESELDRHRHYAALDASNSSRPAPLQHDNTGIEVVAGTVTPKAAPVAPATIVPATFEQDSPVVAAAAASLAENASSVPSDTPRSRTLVKAQAAPRQLLERQVRRDRSRSAKLPAPGPIAIRTAARPKSTAASGAFGLGASGLRWPGE